MENESKKLIVLFPGVGYSVDMPLLYYARFKYLTMGYESLQVNYSTLNRKKPRDEYLEDAKKAVLEQVKDVDFSVYDDILFVSKSLGTAVAGWVSGTLAQSIRHIYLTPLEETLNFIKDGENISIIIAGNEDKALDANILIKHCARENIKLEIIEGAGHSLEIPSDMNANIDILKRVVDLY